MNSLLAITLLAVSHASESPSPATFVRSWRAHSGPVGHVLPLSSDDILTIGHFGDETIKVWGPDGIKKSEVVVGDTVQWVHERSGPDDVVFALMRGGVSALRGGTLTSLATVEPFLSPNAGDAPHRILWTTKDGRLVELLPDGRRSITKPGAPIFMMAADAGWLAAIRGGYLVILDPKRKIYASMPCNLNVHSMAIDAASRTVLIGSSESQTPTSGARLTIYSLEAKRLASRSLLGAAASNVAVLESFAVVQSQVHETENPRNVLTLVPLKGGPPLDIDSFPHEPVSFGVDAKRHRLYVGDAQGNVRMYTVLNRPKRGKALVRSKRR